MPRPRKTATTPLLPPEVFEVFVQALLCKSSSAPDETADTFAAADAEEQLQAQEEQHRQQTHICCQLLQVDRGTRTAVANCCSGKLACIAELKTLEHVESFASWLASADLASNGHIMRSLKLLRSKSERQQSCKEVTESGPDYAIAAGPYQADSDEEGVGWCGSGSSDFEEDGGDDSNGHRSGLTASAVEESGGSAVKDSAGKCSQGSGGDSSESNNSQSSSDDSRGISDYDSSLDDLYAEDSDADLYDDSDAGSYDDSSDSRSNSSSEPPEMPADVIGHYIAAAMQRARQAALAGPAGLLLLQEFSTNVPNAAVLQQLASAGCQVTRLILDFGGDTPSQSWTRSSMAELGQALSGLSGLHSLTLTGAESVTDAVAQYMGLDELVPFLPSLSQLTQLEMQETIHQQYLPAQLLELEYHEPDITSREQRRFYYWSGRRKYSNYLGNRCRGFSLNLAHLTALTKLQYDFGDYVEQDGDDDGTIHHYSFTQRDKLPPNLLELHLPHGTCCFVDPILKLKQLRVLDLQPCGARAKELRELSSLSSLTEVRLFYNGTMEEFYDGMDCDSEISERGDFAAASAWRLLPLKQLGFQVNLTLATPEAAAAATEATAAAERWRAQRAASPLYQYIECDFDRTPEEQSQVAQSLLKDLGFQTGLTALHLGVQLSSKTTSCAAELGLLAEPMRQLRELRSLTLYRFNLQTADSSDDSNAGRAARDADPVVDLARAIAGLPRLVSIRLNALPECLVAAVQQEIQAGHGQAQLKVNAD